MNKEYYNKLNWENQKMKEFIRMLAGLTHFSHKEECRKILKEVESNEIIIELQKLEEIQRKLDSKYYDGISAILDHLFNAGNIEEYDKVHDILFKYKHIWVKIQDDKNKSR